MISPQTLLEELQKPEHEGKSDAQVLEALNAQSIEYFIEPTTADLTNYLMNSGLYLKLLGSYRDHPVAQIRVAAEAALDLASSQIPNVNLQNPSVQQMMGALVQGGVWSEAEAASVLAFARRTRSRAQQLGAAGEVTTQDIQRARNEPALQTLQEREELAGTAWGEVLILLHRRRVALLAGEVTQAPTRQELLAAFGEALGETIPGGAG